MLKAAGMIYLSIAQLKKTKTGELDGVLYRGYKVPVFQDSFGRKVLYFRERFPCFDVYDSLNEDRYYHWYAIRHEKGVTLVYTEDEKPGAQVHEGYVQGAKTDFYCPSWIAGELENAGFFAN